MGFHARAPVLMEQGCPSFLMIQPGCYEKYLSGRGRVGMLRTVNASPINLNSVDAWAIAFDIALAHVLVTIPIIVISIAALAALFLVLMLLHDKVLNFIVNLARRDKETESSLFNSCMFMFVLVAFLAYAFFRFDKFFLVDTMNLQELIFGGFDRSMGFALPTTYRFTSIIDNFEPIKESVITNQTLSKIFTALAGIVALLTALTGLAKLIEYLGKLFKK
jgi:hypothetical protein